MHEKTVLDPTSELRKEISYSYNFMGQRTGKKTGPNEVRYLTDLTRDHYNLLKETVNGKAKTFTYDDNVVSFEEERRKKKEERRKKKEERRKKEEGTTTS